MLIGNQANNKELNNKLNKLISILREKAALAIAFSGGVDSTFLLKVAQDTLKDNVIAVTAKWPIHSEREFKEAVDFVKQLNVRHIILKSDSIDDIEGFSQNPENRCYLCKREIFKKIKEVAKKNGFIHVADGSNIDDLKDYRPGIVALKELGIISPLRDAGLTKSDIRELSRETGLPTWNKPAFACLASRIPYGHEITKEKLEIIDKSEQFLIDSGFKQVRVRHHGDIARIEVSAEERSNFFNPGFMDEVHYKLKQYGFKYITLDLMGYRTGSLNDGVKK
ncbi:MAG: ATP-dependent sacrificial sulfur transferase LarE [Firmicutes bacterium]|nr:ATP-dependent sacrificial sulfur transferase LarE [Bacillota bacterium]